MNNNHKAHEATPNINAPVSIYTNDAAPLEFDERNPKIIEAVSKASNGKTFKITLEMPDDILVQPDLPTVLAQTMISVMFEYELQSWPRATD